MSDPTRDVLDARFAVIVPCKSEGDSARIWQMVDDVGLYAVRTRRPWTGPEVWVPFADEETRTVCLPQIQDSLPVGRIVKLHERPAA